MSVRKAYKGGRGGEYIHNRETSFQIRKILLLFHHGRLNMISITSRKKKRARSSHIYSAWKQIGLLLPFFFFFFFFLFFTLLWNLLSTPRSRRDTSTFIFSRWQTEMDLLILDIYFFVINNGKKKKKKTHWAGNRSQLRMYKCLQNGPPVRSLFELQLKATIVLFTRVKCSDPYMVS